MQRENSFFFAFSNQKSSESHKACFNGRVAFEVEALNESIFGTAKDSVNRMKNQIYLDFSEMQPIFDPFWGQR